jgi:hypothetical protein
LFIYLFRIVALFSALIPISLLLIFRYAPKEADRSSFEQNEFATDGYFIPRIISLVIFIITFLLTMVFLCKIHLALPHEARRIAGISYGTLDKSMKDDVQDGANDGDNDGGDPSNGGKIRSFNPQQNVSDVASQNPSFMGGSSMQGVGGANSQSKLLQRGRGRGLPSIVQDKDETKNLLIK